MLRQVLEVADKLGSGRNGFFGYYLILVGMPRHIPNNIGILLDQLGWVRISME
jgi:hypothetical protein